MDIEFKDLEVCERCNNKTCSFVDAVVKNSFYEIRSESTVCPVGVLTDGSDDNFSSKRNDCIGCGLCVNSCNYQNIQLDCNPEECRFENLSEPQLNAIACSYLKPLLGFAANTNRNKSMLFDGYACTNSGIEFYVEVDWGNDSLECVRRLLADFISLPNHTISNGIVVLQELPSGNRDVLELIDRIEKFPTTSHLQILFTTFRILRHQYLKKIVAAENYESLFYNPKKWDTQTYLEKVMKP